MSPPSTSCGPKRPAKVAVLLWLGCLVASSAAAQPPAPAEAITVSGRAVDERARSVEGAVVKLLPPTDMLRLARIELGLEDPPEALATATTDARGRFALAAPSPGVYALELLDEGSSSHARGLRRALLLVEDAELGSLELARLGRVIVVVRAPDGAPIEHARVGLAVRSERWPHSMHRTGEDGATTVLVPEDSRASWRPELVVVAPGYAVAVRPARGGRVEVRLERGLARRLRVVGAGGSAAADVMVWVAQAAYGVTDAEGRIELRLEERETATRFLAPDMWAAGVLLRGGASKTTPTSSEPERTVVLESPAHVEGRVVDRAGQEPVPGALVAAPAYDATAITDGEGRFSFELPVFGRGSADGRLEVRKAGYLSAVRSERLASGERSAPRFELDRARDLRGVVVDAEGRAVSGAEVVRVDGEGAITSEDGSFRLVLPTRGTNELEVRHPDYAPLRRELTSAELESGSARFVLAPGWLAVGWVLDVEGRAVAGARVELAEFGGRDGRGRPPWLEPEATGHATTDSEGRFAFSRVAPGKYTLRVEREGFAPAAVPGIELPPGNGETDVGTVTLGPGVRVEGVVLAPDRSPLPGVELVLGGGRLLPQRTATSDQEGRFAFADLAPEAELGLWARLEGWVAAQRNVVARLDQPPLEIVLQPGRSLEGVVVNEAGAEVAEALVSLGGVAGGFGGRAQTTLDGTFRLDGLSTGTYRLTASAAGYQMATVEGIELRADEESAPVRVELRRGAVVTGTVRDEDGEPISGVFVEARERARDRFGTPTELRPTPSDAEGRYRVEGLPTGRLTFDVRHRDWSQLTREVTIEVGENEVDFVLEKSPELRALVVDARGEPVSRAQLWVGTGRYRRARETDAEGRLGIPVERGAIVRLSAQKEGLGVSDEVEIEVRDAAPPEIVLQLVPGATVRGLVEGLDVDQLARTSVTASPLSGQQRSPWLSPFDGARPDFEGRFVLEDLRAGRWLIRATERTSGRTVEESIAVEPGTPELDVVLRFEDGATLSGIVLSAGEPVADARLRARGLDVAGEGGARTDAQGAFRFEDVEPGRYQLVVEVPGRSLPHREPVEVYGDTDVVIELATLQLVVRVVSEETGRAVAGATVHIALPERDVADGGPLRSRRQHWTDADGMLRFDGLVPGLYTVEVSHDEHATRVVEARVDDALSEELLVELATARGLTLRVTGPLGAPASRLSITVVDANGKQLLERMYWASEGGLLRADDLPAGRHLLLLSDGDAFAELEVEIPGEERSVQLQRGGFLELSAPELQDSAGRYAIELERTAGAIRRWPSRVPPLRAGYARVGPLPAGQWIVRVEAGDRELVGAAVVEPGRTVAVEVQ